MPTEFYAIPKHFPERQMSTKPLWLKHRVPHPQARIDLLANACLLTEKERVQIEEQGRGRIPKKTKDYDAVRDIIRQGGESSKEKGLYRQCVEFLCFEAPNPGIATERQRMTELGLLAVATPDWALLPPASCLLTVEIQLLKSLITSDDTVFYIIDNPVCKEVVFKVPMFRASSWKGNLRWACGHNLVKTLAEDKEAGRADPNTIESRIAKRLAKRLRLALLFGNEKGVDPDDEAGDAYLDQAFEVAFGNAKGREANHKYRQQLAPLTQKGFRRGRLNFHSTFFDKIGLDIINPHDRKTKAGSNPILFEIVPGKDDSTGHAAGRGIFNLLYVPFDLLEYGNADRLNQARSDLLTVLDGLSFLMLEAGFSAKKWAGYGVVCADNGLKVKIDSGTPALAVHCKSGEDAFKQVRNALNGGGGY